MPYRYPDDPMTGRGQASQEPRSLVVGNEKPGQAQSVGVGVASIPSRLIGGDGIRVTASGFSFAVSLDIAELEVAQGQPNQQWLPVWVEGSGTDDIRRVPVNAIPADATHDNIVYGRQNGIWVPAISSVTIDWVDITGKPATFPPTLPIPTSGVTGLDTKQAEQDGRLSTNEGGIAANAAAITTNANAITTLTNDKVAKAGDAMSGPLTVVTPPVGAAHASSKQYVDTQVATKIGDAPNDGQQYARKNLTWTPFVIPTPAPAVGLVDVGDTPPVSPLDRQLFWESDTGGLFIRFNDGNSTQWVQVASPGIPDAPNDGNDYIRRNGLWVLAPQQLIESGVITVASQPNLQLPAGYKRYKLIWRKIEPVLASSYLCMRMTTDGSTFISAANYIWSMAYHNQTMAIPGSPLLFNSGGTLPALPTTTWCLAPFSYGVQGGNNTNIEIDIDPGVTGYYHNVRWTGNYAGVNDWVWTGGGRYGGGTNVIKSLVTYFNTGNVAVNAEYELWGYR